LSNKSNKYAQVLIMVPYLTTFTIERAIYIPNMIILWKQQSNAWAGASYNELTSACRMYYANGS